MSMTLPAEILDLERLVDQLNQLGRRFLGYDVCENPVSYLRDWALIDTETIRRVGEQVWGTPAATSAAADLLDTDAALLRESLLKTVQDGWQGEAYENFDHYIARVTQALTEETTRMSLVGEALVDIADAFETAWWEILSWALALVGLLVSAIGAALATVGFAETFAATATVVGAPIGIILGTASMVMAFVSGVIAVASATVTYMSSVLPRLYELESARSTLEAPASSGVGTLPPPPGGTDGWEPR